MLTLTAPIKSSFNITLEDGRVITIILRNKNTKSVVVDFILPAREIKVGLVKPQAPQEVPAQPELQEPRTLVSANS